MEVWLGVVSWIAEEVGEAGGGWGAVCQAGAGGLSSGCGVAC